MRSGALIILFTAAFLISPFMGAAAGRDYPIEEGPGECKSIIAKGDATPGDHTLHMKIRDPSRGGDQVLFICEPGYEYTYHHPTTGEDMHFTVENRVIGVASSGDTPPNIIKAGMALTDRGISYGDNDIPLLYCNPSEYAWDDFDWLRYGYQTADSEDSSVTFLVDGAVHELHATGKGEALYVVGPDHAYVIEANAVDAVVDEVDDIYVRTNYPVKLWETATKESHQYGPHFDSRFDGWARTGETVKLGPGCIYGILVEEISDDSVKVRAIHRDTEAIDINEGEVKSLCGFRVGLEETESGLIPRARITLCYHYLEWEERMEKIVMSRYGNITLEDMMGWSRLHGEDLGGLRPMCEGTSDNAESVAIYSIPDRSPEVMSSFWYTCHSCASIYAPVHICVERLHEPYTTEEAYGLFKESFMERGHSSNTSVLQSVEEVFINENRFVEKLAFDLLEVEKNERVPELMTHSDLMIQKHALLMIQLLLKGGRSLGVIEDMWRGTYEDSFEGFEGLLSELTSDGISGSEEDIVELLMRICDSAAYHKLGEAECMEGQDSEGVKGAKNRYEEATKHREAGRYEKALGGYRTSFLISQRVLKGEDYTSLMERGGGPENTVIVSILAVVVLAIIGVVFVRRKFKSYDN